MFGRTLEMMNHRDIVCRARKNAAAAVATKSSNKTLIPKQQSMAGWLAITTFHWSFASTYVLIMIFRIMPRLCAYLAQRAEWNYTISIYKYISIDNHVNAMAHFVVVLCFFSCLFLFAPLLLLHATSPHSQCMPTACINDFARKSVARTPPANYHQLLIFYYTFSVFFHTEIICHIYGWAASLCMCAELCIRNKSVVGTSAQSVHGS